MRTHTQAHADAERRFIGEAADTVTLSAITEAINENIAQGGGQGDAEQGARAVHIGKIVPADLGARSELSIKREERLDQLPARPAHVQVEARAVAVTRLVGYVPHEGEAFRE